MASSRCWRATPGVCHSTVIDRAAGVRRLGSAALSLCYVAGGRHDAFFEDGLSPLDYAAAVLVLQEAGGLLTAGDGLPLHYNRRVPRHRTLYGAGRALQPALVSAGRRTLGAGA